MSIVLPICSSIHIVVRMKTIDPVCVKHRFLFLASASQSSGLRWWPSPPAWFSPLPCEYPPYIIGSHPGNPRHRQAHRHPPRKHQEDQPLAPCSGHCGLYGAEPCVYRSISTSFLSLSWGICLLSSCYWQLFGKVYRASFSGSNCILNMLPRHKNSRSFWLRYHSLWAKLSVAHSKFWDLVPSLLSSCLSFRWPLKSTRKVYIYHKGKCHKAL